MLDNTLFSYRTRPCSLKARVFSQMNGLTLSQPCTLHFRTARASRVYVRGTCDGARADNQTIAEETESLTFSITGTVFHLSKND